jgi:hypothetical protein
LRIERHTHSTARKGAGDITQGVAHAHPYRR